jgi:pilus assembly protein Flp/PilA
MLRRLRRDRHGATAIEYGLIVALIALGMLGGLEALGGGVNGSWGRTAAKVANAMK